MLSRLFGPRVAVTVRVLGQVGDRMVRWEGDVRVKAPATLAEALKAAGRSAGVDLAGALAAGAQPALLVNGERVPLPEALNGAVPTDATITWLMPMAGG